MGKRGPQPKPTHLRLIDGTRRGGRTRLNPNEPMPAPCMPSMPAYLEAAAQEEWKRLSRKLFTLGLLTELDRGVLAAVCAAYGRWVTAEENLEKMGRPLLYKTTNGNWIQHPLVGTANRAAHAYVRLAAEFGMSPAARANIAQGPQASRHVTPQDDNDGTAQSYF
jgi:P27 family predicted phage terminase small subunit